MFRSFRLGRAFGIPVYIHPTFLLLPAWVVLSYLGSGPAMMLFALAVLFAAFGCVVLHELGHALMARHFGIGTRDITLYPIGGVARLERMSERPGEEIAIALAGPAVNLAIVLLLSPVVFLAAFVLPPEALAGTGWGLAPVVTRFLLTLWVCNGFLLLFNLVPAFPMDGGRVLRAVLSLGLGQLRATEIAAAVGLVVAGLGVLAGVLSVSPMWVVLAVFVAFAGQAELRALRRREAMRQMAAVPAMSFGPFPQAGEPAPVPPANAEVPGFSGFVWFGDQQAWVLFHNGRPVMYPSGPAE